MHTTNDIETHASPPSTPNPTVLYFVVPFSFAFHSDCHSDKALTQLRGTPDAYNVLNAKQILRSRATRALTQLFLDIDLEQYVCTRIDPS